MAGIGTVFGSTIVSGSSLGSSLLGFGNDDRLEKLFQKNKDLVVLNDRPWNVETPPHLLRDKITPASKLFMRNNGSIPDIDQETDWTLKIDGESAAREVSISLADLKKNFKHYSYHLTIECGGNGRAEFYPPAKGNQWTTGAVACSEWTGVRLRDVLEYVGLKEDAVYVAYYGVDKHLSGDPTKVVISRGVPMHKALEEETLLAFKMNGEDIPLAHGFPLRLVVGGWPGSASGKWVNRISIRNIVHDGPKMTGDAYRVPCQPVSPGSEIDPAEMCIIESMPVKSMITYPKSGAVISGNTIPIEVHAWAGDLAVEKVEYSIDFGVTWKACTLGKPVNRLAWQQFSTTVELPGKGYYEIWAKATDTDSRQQPMIVPGWNPKGYLNNACHRIAIRVV